MDTGCSDTNIDGERLFKDIATAVQQLNSEGYEVICMTEVTSDRYNWGTTGGQFNAGYGYGYSITEGVTIVARKVS